MSLRNQFSLVLLALFATVLSAIVLVSVSGTQRYLEQQLASHAQDAATTLSVTLGQALGKGDTVLAEANVLSLFDRGYFKRITVLSNDRKPIMKHEMAEKIEGVPLWFVTLFPIRTAAGEAFVGSGWKQLGKVLVVSQPTFAYQYLWLTTAELLGWILALCTLAWLSMYLVLYYILKPLRAIEKAAQDVQAKRFEPIVYQPRAPELATVVAAMNQMSHRVGEMLNTETARAQALHRKAYRDELTGLLNRSGYELALAELLTGDEHFALGSVMSVELDDLRLLIRAHGFALGERIIRSVKQSASAVFALFPSALMARSNEFSFSFVTSEVTEAQAAAMATELQHQIMDQLKKIEHAEMVSITIGTAFFYKNETRTTVFARADLALEIARQSGRNGLAVLASEPDRSSAIGSFAWRTLIKTALQEERLRLVYQTVFSLAANPVEIQRECMARLIDAQGEGIAAKSFIPMATRHRLMTGVDRAVVTMMLSDFPQDTEASFLVAVNLSPQSIVDTEFMRWLDTQLGHLKDSAAKLAFELPKFGVANNPAAAIHLRTVVRQHGGKFGIDNFSLDAEAMKLVRDIAPDYVKLTGSLIAELPTQADAQEMLKSFVTLAHSLDVTVIAERVEHLEQITALAAADVDAAQGYYFNLPE